jgi:hypothetical protein
MTIASFNVANPFTVSVEDNVAVESDVAPFTVALASVASPFT